jgi:hypothetical protein
MCEGTGRGFLLPEQERPSCELCMKEQEGVSFSRALYKGTGEAFLWAMYCLKSKTELWDTDELLHSIERRITLKGWVNINSYHALEFHLSDLGKNLKFWFLFPSRIIPSV